MSTPESRLAFVAVLLAAWECHPELRAGQILVLGWQRAPGLACLSDLKFLGDTDLAAGLERLMAAVPERGAA